MPKTATQILTIAVLIAVGVSIEVLSLHFVVKGQALCQQNHGALFCWVFSRWYAAKALFV